MQINASLRSLRALAHATRRHSPTQSRCFGGDGCSAWMTAAMQPYFYPLATTKCSRPRQSRQSFSNHISCILGKLQPRLRIASLLMYGFFPECLTFLKSILAVLFFLPGKSPNHRHPRYLKLTNSLWLTACHWLQAFSPLQKQLLKPSNMYGRFVEPLKSSRHCKYGRPLDTQCISLVSLDITQY